MKKTLLGCFILILAATALFVSCNAETAVPVDDVAYIRFDGETRDLSVKYETKDYADLYWFYTAVKADGYGTSGEKTTETLVNTDSNYKGFSKTVGPFSQGKWTFTLNAYSSLADSSTTSPKEDAKVYESGEFTVVLTGGETKSVAVNVDPVGDYGYLAFDGATFDYAVEQSQTTITPTAPHLKITATRTTVNKDGYYPTYVLTDDNYTVQKTKTEIKLESSESTKQKYTISFNQGDITSLPMEKGTYKCVVSAYIDGGENTPLVTQTFYFGIYGTATTYIKGNLVEGVTSEVNFDVAKQSIITQSLVTTNASDAGSTLVSAEMPFKASVSPKTDSNVTTNGANETNVTFAKGALDLPGENETTVDYSLSVTVTEAAAGDNAFQIDGKDAGSLKGSVALELKKIVDGVEQEEPVTDFKNTEVTVGVYIGSIEIEDSSQTSGKRTVSSLTEESDLKKYFAVVYTGKDGENVEEMTLVSYTNGVLTFKTTHFSNFAIIDRNSLPAIQVTNGNEKAYYATLEEAVEKATEGSTIKLQLATSLSKDVSTSKKLTIDLGGKLLTAEDGALVSLLDGAGVEVRNAKPDEEGGTNQAVFINGTFTAVDGSTVNGTYAPALFKVNETKYPTLSAAVEALGDTGGTVTLLQNMTLRETVSVSKAVTIDLDKYTLTAYTERVKVTDGGVVTVAGKSASSFISGVEVCNVTKNGNTEVYTYYYYPTLEAAQSSKKGSIKLLLEELDVKETITFNEKTSIDLNGCTVNMNGKSFEIYSKVSISNGTIKNNTGSVASNTFNIYTKGDLSLENVDVEETSTGSAAVIFFKDGSNPGSLSISGVTLTMNGGGFGIGTNASKGTDYLDIEIAGSTITVTNTSEDNAGLLINVPSVVTITDSVISGQRQGAILRGGTYVIKNSTFKSTGTKTTGYDWTDNDEGNNNWGSGTKVPLAALVIGNRSASDYRYPTSVTLEGVTLSLGESSVRKQIYVSQQNDGDTEYTVTVRGADAAWTVNKKDTMGGAAYGVTEAKIGDVSYGTLEEAVAKAVSGDTIVLQGDLDLTDYKAGDFYTFEFAKDITLDLNGHTITSYNGGVAYEGDGLLIKNGKFVCADGGSYALFIGNGNYYDDGSLYEATVDNIECEGGINVFVHALIVESSEQKTKVSGTTYYALYVDPCGVIIVDGGEFTSTSTKGGCVIYTSQTNAYIGINGGTFKAEGNVNLFSKTAVLEVKGGTFSKDPSSKVPFGYGIEKQDDDMYVVKETRYTISTPAQLMEFRDAVNEGYTFEGETITLCDDIDLSEVKNWTPIGEGTRKGSGYTDGTSGTMVSTPFKGTFDGDGHTISNLKIESKTSNGDDYAVGLFGVLDGGCVKNLTLENVKITNTESLTGKSSTSAGAVVGVMCNKASLSNVTVGSQDENEKSTVEAGAAGGLVGRMTVNCTIEKCTNYAEVNGGAEGAGGIVCKAYYTVDDSIQKISECKNYGKITSTQTGHSIGGIAAYANAVNIDKCENHGDISGAGVAIGGIVGEFRNKGSLSACSNEGKVSNTSTESGIYGLGGIVGWIRYNEAGMTVTSGDKKNYMSAVEITGNTNKGVVDGGNAVSGAGGIVGMLYSTGKVNSNNNYAESITGNSFVSGIVGGYQALSEATYMHDDEHAKATEIKSNTSTTQEGNIKGDSCVSTIVYINDSRVTLVSGNSPDNKNINGQTT